MESEEEKGIRGKKLSTMEDLIELAGVTGLWSWVVLGLCSSAGMILAFQSLSYQFLGYTPDHWCKVEPLIDANWTQEQIVELAIPFNEEKGRRETCRMLNYNYTLAAELGYNASIREPSLLHTGQDSTVTCQHRFFNTSEGQITVATQWDLVCEKRALYSTVQGITQAGYLLGSLIFGHLMESYGRRLICIICVVIALIVKIIALFSPTIIFYITARGIASICVMGIYTANFLIAVETCSPRQRSTVAALYIVQWTIGYMAVPGIAYFVHNWKWLHVILTFPYFILLISFGILPESPRWSLLHGRHKDALSVLKRAAAINRQTLPSDDEILAAMDKITQKELESKEDTAELGLKQQMQNTMKSIFDVWIDPRYRTRLFFLVFGWFSCSFVYYGISLSATNLSTNLYIYVFLGGLLEVPVYLLLWLWLNYRGRRLLMATLLVVCGVCIALLSTIMFLVPNASVVATTFLSLCGKFSITGAFHLIWIYTAELFPTQYRSQAVGQGNVFGRLGSFFSPYINDILGEVTVWGPSVTYALVSLLAAGFMLLLPESKGRSLPETTAEGKEAPNDDETSDGTFSTKLDDCQTPLTENSLPSYSSGEQKSQNHR